MEVTAATREGRAHRKGGLPCQDAVAWRQLPDRGAVALAVADGLGSKPLSHEGSRVAADAAVARLADEPVWDVRAMQRAFRAARRAIRMEAKRHGAPPGDLATTLQLGVLEPGRALVAMVGDGGMVAGDEGGAHVLVAPGLDGYANEVTPVTSAWWRLAFTCRERQGATWLAAFSDGLTRLLMTRSDGAWHPHAPFFDAFIPRVGDEQVAARFLAGDGIDKAWDDDKSLVVARATG